MRYSIDMKEFWQINKQCLQNIKEAPRVPVGMSLDGDWICEFLGLDNALYYSNFDYQQEQRLRCSEFTEREISYKIYPSVDFGVIMDASIYGGKVNYESNATPTLKPVLNDPSEIDDFVEKIRNMDILESGLVPKYLEWREKISQRYGINLTSGGGIKGCATMLGQICGITNFLTWIATDPEEIEKLVTCWLEISIKYIKTLRRETNYPVGKNGFSFASDVAGMLSPRMFKEMIFNAEKKLYEEFAPNKQDSRFYHADSHMLHHLDTLKEMGVNQVNIDPYIDPEQILSKLSEAVIFGQIPPLKILLSGTAEDVIACARRDILQAGKSKQLVLTTAGSINPGTSFENLRAMCFAAQEYGDYSKL